MSKYLIKFTKCSIIRYISHLDLMRLFHRAFKRSRISLTYSQGFNPHPKMSFAQPLSLGYTSVGEYLEFETLKEYSNNEVMERLNLVMPAGIKVTDCWKLKNNNKTAAALVCWGSYEITCQGDFDQPPGQAVQSFLQQNQILIQKPQKKRKEMTEIDIKPLISQFKIIEEKQGQVKFLVVLRAGSQANLNPELLMAAFYAYMQKIYVKEDVSIKRLELFDQTQKALYEIHER
ncbi:MAG: TIGR03936 family radical SAM-associated protein [Eubacteriales bacterium]|nr:TIGR03936 family radical SAM-associated protein [Eubacteriales bacterium]